MFAQNKYHQSTIAYVACAKLCLDSMPKIAFLKDFNDRLNMRLKGKPSSSQCLKQGLIQPKTQTSISFFRIMCSCLFHG